MKVSDSLDNVPNENVVTQQVTNQPTDRVSDQLLELLEWLFATKNLTIMLCYMYIFSEARKINDVFKIMFEI